MLQKASLAMGGKSNVWSWWGNIGEEWSGLGLTPSGNVLTLRTPEKVHMAIAITTVFVMHGAARQVIYYGLSWRTSSDEQIQNNGTHALAVTSSKLWDAQICLFNSGLSPQETAMTKKTKFETQLQHHFSARMGERSKFPLEFSNIFHRGFDSRENKIARIEI